VRRSQSPKTAFLRFPPVHSADLEGQQSVGVTHSTLLAV
jgi:hypothetical protein